MRPDLAERLQTALSFAGQQLVVAEEHLGGMEHCLDGEGPVTPVYTLARVAAECSGRAMWLAETAIGPHERAGRGVAVRLQSLTEAGDLFPAGHAGRRNQRARRREVKAEAAAQGLDVPELESTHDLVKRALGDEGLGRFAVKLNSAFAHGTPYTLLTLLERVTGDEFVDDDDGIVSRPMVTSPSREALAVAPGLLAYLPAAQHYLEWVGFEGTQWRTLINRAAVETHRLMNLPTPP